MLAVPMLAVVLAEPFLTLIDTWFIGTVLAADQAKAGLAALSANCSLFNLITCCFSFFTMSSTAIVARAGGGPKAAGQGVKNGVFLAWAMASLLSGFLILYTTPVLVLGYGIDPSVASFTPAVEYLRIRALAIPAILTQNVLVGVCLGVKESRAPVLGCAASALTNIVLDYLFISVYGWGVAGAAAATAAASYTGILAIWALLRRKIHIEEPWRMPSLDDLKPFVKTSATLFLGSTACGL
jgi:Na+-driven multidrug efflux pump